MTQPTFQGIIPPTVTPLDASGEVDIASLDRLTQRVLDAGVHGLFVLGSSGEGASLPESARAQVIERAVRLAGGRVPVLVGAIAPSTMQATRYAAQAEELGADAVVASTPFFIRVSEEEVAAHLRGIAAAARLPVLAYEVSVATGHSISLALLSELAQDGTIVGVKDSSLDDVRLRQLLLLRDEVAPHLSVLTGHECFVDGALLAGVDGAVPGLGNVDPHGYVRLWEAARAGEWERARSEQERLVRLMQVAAVSATGTGPSASGLGGFKTALEALGVIATNTMTPPLTALTDEARERVAAILRDSGLSEQAERARAS